MRIKIIKLLLSLLASSSLFAESGISLVHADLTQGRLVMEQQITTFYGNVHFRQDTLDMYCDSAKYYDKEKYADFDGNVIVLDGIRTLRAKRIEYYPSEKTAYCYDSVQIVSNIDSMYAESLIYNFNTKNAKAAINFYALDRKENVDVYSEKGEYINANRWFSVHQNSILTRIDSTTNDTMRIYAQKIEYFAADSAYAIASDSVTILQNELTATADSAVYHVKKQVIWLRKKPEVLYDKNNLSGEIIKVELDSNRVKNIFSFKDAKALERVDSLENKYNRLEAQTIEMQIVNNKPHLMIASGNATSRYYLKNKEGAQGMNKASADTLLLYFSKGEMDSLSIIGGSEGTYFPENYYKDEESE
jgi:lipopolysaccharide export system protein LptA